MEIISIREAVEEVIIAFTLFDWQVKDKIQINNFLKFHFTICNCESSVQSNMKNWELEMEKERGCKVRNAAIKVWHNAESIKLNARCVYQYLWWCYTGPSPQPAAGHPPVQCRPAPPGRPGERKEEMHFWCSLWRIISLCCNFLYFRLKLQLLVAIAEMLRKYLF